MPYARRLVPLLLFAVLFACRPAEAPDLSAFRALVSQQPDAVFDLWIRHGTVIDGTGRPARPADVLVRWDEIAYVGPVDTTAFRARQVIDATGKVVTPGFIDAHAHGDPLSAPGFHNFLAMGVTTICLGQDGGSPPYEDLRGWMERVDSAGPGVNIALFAGHGTLRHLSGIGYDTEPAPSEIARMETLLEEAVHKMSGLTAATIGLPDRGALVAGQKADIAVFDPAQVQAVADFSEPHRLARGFEWVIVNGAVAWKEGQGGERRGKMLRKQKNLKTEEVKN